MDNPSFSFRLCPRVTKTVTIARVHNLQDENGRAVASLVSHIAVSRIVQQISPDASLEANDFRGVTRPVSLARRDIGAV